MVLEGFLSRAELRLEEWVEAIFTPRGHRPLQPVDLDRSLKRTMRKEVRPLVRTKYVPNVFEVKLSPSDHEAFAPLEPEILEDLQRSLRAFQREERVRTVGPLAIRLSPDSTVKPGEIRVLARLQERP